MSIAYDHMKEIKNKKLAWYNSVDILMKLGAKYKAMKLQKSHNIIKLQLSSTDKSYRNNTNVYSSNQNSGF